MARHALMKKAKWPIFVTRVSLGWAMLYAGSIKILNPEWSAEGYLVGAKTFPDFYAFFTQPSVLPITNFLNEWGLALIGVSLIVGLFVRWSGYAGALLMLLYYFPVLEFPHISEYLYIIDDHIIYALVFIILAEVRAGNFLGIDSLLKARR
jgi:thiosulfate dehydrogenase (quinone) large subunit